MARCVVLAFGARLLVGIQVYVPDYVAVSSLLVGDLVGLQEFQVAGKGGLGDDVAAYGELLGQIFLGGYALMGEYVYYFG